MRIAIDPWIGHSVHRHRFQLFRITAMHIEHKPLHGKLTVVLAVVAAIFLIVHELEIHLPQLEVWIESLGVFAPLAFIGLFVILTPLFISVDTLCFVAGLLFSIVAAEFYMIVATYLASALIFFLGRHLFKERVIALLAKHKRFAALDTAINSQPLKLMFLLRLTPLPFAMLSYALSVTEVRFRTYLLATSGIFLYNGSLVYMGYTTKHLAGLISGSTQPSTVSYPLLMLGLLILVCVLFYVAKMAGDTLKQIDSEKAGV
ncbi:MAG: TVP38/TMEM64 family protein [Candidatus Methylumidiphilus sp.]